MFRFKENDSEIYSSSLSRQSSETKINTYSVLKLLKVRNHCFVSNITSPINKMFMALIYLKILRFQSAFATVILSALAIPSIQQEFISNILTGFDIKFLITL